MVLGRSVTVAACLEKGLYEGSLRVSMRTALACGLSSQAGWETFALFNLALTSKVRDVT